MSQTRRDALRREVARIDGRGNTTRTEYDALGRVAATIDALTNATTYAYDGWGNLTNTSYSDDTPTVTVAYDALGRQREAHDAAGVTTFAYDAYGANTNETVIGVAGANVLERYTDAYGRDAGCSLNGARQTILGYDEQTGRLATMQTPSANASTSGNASSGNSSPDNSSFPIPNSSFTWTYLPNSDLKSQLAYPNGLTASWTYDANNQLLQVCNATPTNVISQCDYTYDAAGRRVACARSGDAMSVADTIAYAYNARGELTNAVSNVDANYAYSYQYDDIGNRITSSERGTNTTYAANELNQYTSIVGGPVESEPAFDDDGNQTHVRTATGEWRVTYNGENRPILWEQIEQSEQSTNRTILIMSYDRMGRRVTKNDERFVYNGYLQVANNLSSEMSADGNQIYSNQLRQQSFVWDPTEQIATRPLYAEAGGEAVVYVFDANKNVSELVEFDNLTLVHCFYSPFGQINESKGNIPFNNPFFYSSEHYDAENGAFPYTYRTYVPLSGNWLTRDPFWQDRNISPYAFEGGISSYDRLGLVNWDMFCNGALSAVGGLLTVGGVVLGNIAASAAVPVTGGASAYVMGVLDAAVVGWASMNIGNGLR